MLELEGTVKRWDEVQAEAERLTALIRRYGCNPLPPTSCASCRRHHFGYNRISVF